MNEFFYHALGICGEHSHPNLINMLFLGAVAFVSFKVLARRVRSDR
tara:strand:+ start:12459 stop:12596 length:138 start_codon:yes stop_codon:yes gene_type:complete